MFGSFGLVHGLRYKAVNQLDLYAFGCEVQEKTDAGHEEISTEKR